jgi:hypothetical protein
LSNTLRHTPHPATEKGAALYRGRNFAPRLYENDTIFYLTVKGRYLGDRESGWRAVAILRVIKRLESHSEAASWYADQSVDLPSNCLVQGNPPLAFQDTHGHTRPDIRRRAQDDTDRLIRLWDGGYQSRATNWPVFLVCRALFLELRDPRSFLKKTWIASSKGNQALGPLQRFRTGKLSD